MNNSESYVLSVLKRYYQGGEWKFVEMFDENDNPRPQAKFYEEFGFWVSYPDFEYYNQDKLVLLVEVKGLIDFFDGETGKIGMKFRNYKSYQRVKYKENVDLKICVVVKYRNKKTIFWEEINNIYKFPYEIKVRNYTERNYETGIIEEKTDKFIVWDAMNFRTDEENIVS